MIDQIFDQIALDSTERMHWLVKQKKKKELEDTKKTLMKFSNEQNHI
jgi:hypothetical protein